MLEVVLSVVLTLDALAGYLAAADSMSVRLGNLKEMAEENRISNEATQDLLVTLLRKELRKEL